MALKGWKSQRSENFFGIWGNKNQNIWNCLFSPIYRGLCYAAFAKKEMVDPARSLKVSFLETLCAKQGMGFFSLSKGQYISIFHVWRSDYYIFRTKIQKSKYLLLFKFLKFQLLKLLWKQGRGNNFYLRGGGDTKKIT